jgi:glycolate oxidase FAD binding subunit
MDTDFVVMAETATLPKRPTTGAELARVVGEAAGAGVQVRVAGSDSLPLIRMEESRPVQTVSTLRMNKVIEHAVSDMTVIVQAGMSLEALQRHLAWQNQWLPVDPPAYRGGPGGGPGQRTIGGLIATNSLGPLRFGTGDWRLLIMGMTWVDGNGELIKGGGRTVKNVAGYSSPRMMIGSCGTLGAIAEVTLRTFARPADEQCVIFFCDTAERAEQVIAEVMVSPTNPAYIEAIGGRTFAANPLDLPTMKRGVAVVVGYLDRPQSCVAQLEILRGLNATKGLESISQTAAQAGRLRLWLTREPAIAEGQAGLGARLHTVSSNVAAAIVEIETLAAASGGHAWTVSEAATGVIRTVITAPDAEIILPHIAKKYAASILLTQPSSAAAVTGAAVLSEMSRRIKGQLDPRNTYGQLR